MRLYNKIHQNGLIAAIVLAGILLLSQGCSDSPGSSGAGEDGEVGFSCEELALDKHAAEPITTIMVKGIGPALGDEPFAWIYDDESEFDEKRVITFLERTSDDEATLIVPAHPVQWREGGTVTVVIESEDGNILCDGMELYIEALEPAEIGLGEFIEEMLTDLNEMIENNGYDLQEIKNSYVFDVDPWLVGITALVQTLDGLSNPENIESQIFSNSSVTKKDDSANIDDDLSELLDAAISKTGIYDELREIVDQYKGVFDCLENKHSTFKNGYQKKGVSENSLIGFNFPDYHLEPSALNCKMTIQAKSRYLNTGVTKHLHEFSSIVVGGTSATLAVVGTAAALPPVIALGAKLGIVGNLLTAIGIAIDLSDHLLPSELLEIELNASPLVYYENKKTVGSWSAELDAKSKEWILEWPQVIGMVPVAGPSGKVLAQISKKVDEFEAVTKSILGFGQWLMSTVWEIEEDSGPLSVEPTTFSIEGGITPDRDNEEDYFSWSINTIVSEIDDAIFVFDTDETKYHPHSVGISELTISTVSNRFNNQHRESIEELEIKPIEVTIRPRNDSQEHYYGGPPFLIETGEDKPIDLMAEVKNVNAANISWGMKGIGFMVEDVNGDPFMADYHAPYEESIDYVFAVVDAAGGARDHPNAPVRGDTVRVMVAESELVIDGSPGCLRVNQELQLSAFFYGEEISFSDLEWDISGPGNLGSDGIYTSSAKGDVVIEFWTKENTNIRYSLVFQVRTVCSYLRATVTRPWETNRVVAFEYTTPHIVDFESTCISLLPYQTDRFGIRDMLGDNAWAMTVSDHDNFTHNLYLHKSIIENDGEWEKELHASSMSGMWFDETLHAIEFWSYDSGHFTPGWSGSNFTNISSSPSPRPVELKREIVTIDGEETAVFSGNYFNLRVQNQMGAMFYLKVQFEGVVPGEKGCF